MPRRFRHARCLGVAMLVDGAARAEFGHTEGVAAAAGANLVDHLLHVFGGEAVPAGIAVEAEDLGYVVEPALVGERAGRSDGTRRIELADVVAQFLHHRLGLAFFHRHFVVQFVEYAPADYRRMVAELGDHFAGLSPLWLGSVPTLFAHLEPVAYCSYV